MNNAARNHQFITRQHKPVEALSDKEMHEKYFKRCHRTDKTAKDHKNGNPQRAIQRHQARTEWHNNSKATADKFPL